MGQNQQPANRREHSAYGEDHGSPGRGGGLWDTVTGATAGFGAWVGGADLAKISMLSPIEKAKKMQSALENLEYQLAHPLVVASVGRAYRQVTAVAEAVAGDAYHKSNPHERPNDDLLNWNSTPEMEELLDLLESENMYPCWRREALEAAYTLFFEDVAASGNASYLNQLPEPPVGKTVPLHQAVRTTGQQDVAGIYQSGSRLWRCTIWEYGIHKTDGAYVPGASEILGHAEGGRQIVLKNRSTRYCACAGGSFLARVCSPSQDDHPITAQKPSHAPPNVNYHRDALGSAIPRHENRVRRSQKSLSMPHGDSPGVSRAEWEARPVTIEHEQRNSDLELEPPRSDHRWV